MTASRAPEREPTIVAFFSPLGGVQRTTTTLLTGSLLAEQGYHVLVVDTGLDMAAYSGVMAAALCPEVYEPAESVELEASLRIAERLEECIQNKLKDNVTLLELFSAASGFDAAMLLKEKKPVEATWLKGAKGVLHLVPSTRSNVMPHSVLAKLSSDTTRWSTAKRLYSRLKDAAYEHGYHYVLLDLGPGLRPIAEEFLVLSRFVVMLSRADEVSVIRFQAAFVSSTIGPCFLLPPGRSKESIISNIIVERDVDSKKGGQHGEDRRFTTALRGDKDSEQSIGQDPCRKYLELTEKIRITETKHAFIVYTFVPLRNGDEKTMRKISVIHEYMRGFFYNYLPELYSVVGFEETMMTPGINPLEYAWSRRRDLSHVFGDLEECQAGAKPSTRGHGGLSRVCAVLRAWREAQLREAEEMNR